MPQRTKSILIAASAAVIVVVLIVIALIQNGKDRGTTDAESAETSTLATMAQVDKDEASSTGNQDGANARKVPGGEEVKIPGTWYSDRSDEDAITFSEDGTYESTAWLAPGTYQVENETVTLTDKFGLVKELTVKWQDGGAVLFSDNQNYSHTYYASPELAKQGSGKGLSGDADIQADYKMIIDQLLPGSWISKDQRKEVVFKDQGFKLQNTGETDAAKADNYAFTITDISLHESYYLVAMEIKDLASGQTTTMDEMKIAENEYGSFSLSAESFPYQDTFNKTGPVAISGSLSDPNRFTGKVTEVPLFSEEEKKAIAAGIVGTWKGSVDPMRDGNVLHETFIFGADGKYSISYEGYSEKGSYSLVLAENNSLYPHLLLLKSGEETKELLFGMNMTDQTLDFESMDLPELQKQ
ncbi:hypothetical protein [Paenibacillus vini]|uniref:Uncharacterized protein n=1 Tax=Paenibacillus vini TaxID=1476024 RepID=A0ABQ4MAG1_9BACL|nr:hypothetical protein [Paenibacillus vini]GIP52985.1 hypothetical protein J42TS3_20200 [Paenibacillus vini]